MTENSVLVAAAIFLAIAIYRKLAPVTWGKVTQRYRWLVPLALAVVYEVAMALQTGECWRRAALRGVVSGLSAAGMHTMFKALPGPYRG